jgi:DNA modification methylase
MTQSILYGDNLQLLKTFPANHFCSIITDPPYGLSFMNKKWDYQVPSIEFWREAIRVLKPGGHVLSFGGTRTYHRMVVNMEDAGFEIRDQLQWLYGSGFPKSMDISKALDQNLGLNREIIGTKKTGKDSPKKDGKMHLDKKTFIDEKGNTVFNLTAPAGELSKLWDGWGTALKPACEPICMARKPFTGTVAENIKKWNVGGINILESRIPFQSEEDRAEAINKNQHGDFESGARENRIFGADERPRDNYDSAGRWPANVILDQAAAAMLDEQTLNLFGASRFFYVAKPSQFERNKGLGHLEKRKVNDGRQTEMDTPFQRGESLRANTHVTVKPIDLMAYLIKLVTPKNGRVLDPFSGSGSTGIACKLNHFDFVGIDNDLESCQIAEARLKAWNPELYTPQTLF